MAPQLELQGVRVETELDERIPPIEAHYNRLEQIVFNLVANARDAIIEKRGADGNSGAEAVVTIKTYRKGDDVVLLVSDRGSGVPRYARERIFEPFFTTKSDRGAAGLGLSITYGIVEDYRGRITFTSDEGRGAAFKVTFPRAYESVDDTS